MSTRLTPSQQLAEMILGQPLSDYVTEKRTARPRWPWRLIAEQLSADTDGRVNLSHEALRSWYGDEPVAATG